MTLACLLGPLGHSQMLVVLTMLTRCFLMHLLIWHHPPDGAWQ